MAEEIYVTNVLKFDFVMTGLKYEFWLLKGLDCIYYWLKLSTHLDRGLKHYYLLQLTSELDIVG